MATSKFSIEESLDFGWSTLTGKFGTVVLYLILPSLLVHFLPFGVKWMFNDASWANLMASIINLIIIMGVLRVSLKLVDGDKPTYWNFRSKPSFFFKFFGAGILLIIMFICGAILFIVPGIIVYLTFMFVFFVLIDQRPDALGIIGALKKSAAITKGAKWKLLLFSLLCMAIHLVGLLCFLIGAVPASIINSLAIAHVYRQLLKNSDITTSADVA